MGLGECLLWLLVSSPSGLTDPGEPDGVGEVTEDCVVCVSSDPIQLAWIGEKDGELKGRCLADG